ncbi:MAG: hypothetical protein IJR00_03420 [Lachnospiraceae bacterium]|nr:hypothetical protein [Lachnospiraceae bacterium]
MIVPMPADDRTARKNPGFARIFSYDFINNVVGCCLFGMCLPLLIALFTVIFYAAGVVVLSVVQYNIENASCTMLKCECDANDHSR